MAEPARYLFDSVFALERAGDDDPVRYEEAELQSAAASAREEGFKAGHAAGRAEAISETELKLATACDRIFDTLPGLLQDADQRVATAEQCAIDIALLAARKMSRALVARYPLVEVTDLFRQAVEEVRTAPHVVLHVHESLSEPLGERIEKLARQTGVEGRVIVLGDPDMVPGDARVEWADGGMERAMADVEIQITEAAKRFALRLSQTPTKAEDAEAVTEAENAPTDTPDEPESGN